MNKYIKVFGIMALMIFSFYYTEKIALYVQNNTPLKKEILTYKDNNYIDYVNAEVSGEYIIPGINGLIVNVDKSYNNMKSYNVFSEKYLVYDEVIPKISINSFSDKIIHQGNIRKNAVSIIINNNSKYKSYFDDNNIKYDLVNNTNYCIKNSEDKCNHQNKLVVKPTINLNNLNFLKELSNISKGYIIYIEENLNFTYIDALINYIKYNNLNIFHLNKHLSENYQL